VIKMLKNLLSDDSANVRQRVFGVSAVLALVNLLSWLWALAAFGDKPVLLGTAVLAYSLGLRHALDADHIAAIDNVTRKLMQEGRRPVSVGLFFALGHSTVVVVASIAIALTAQSLTAEFAGLRTIGGILGTSVSALFLFLIAIANLITLRTIYTAFRRAVRGDKAPDQGIDVVLAHQGWLARLFKPLFRFVSKSWHLYPIGLLFALGFETASEISLFGLSAQASNDVSGWSILIFPALFAAGMTAVDTADGVLMLGAYGWAYTNPVRKLFYNLTITAISALVALVVGGVEALGLLAEHLGLTGPFWDFVTNLNSNFGLLGYAIVGLFIVSWIVSVIVYYVNGYERCALTILLAGTSSTVVASHVSSHAADLSVASDSARPPVSPWSVLSTSYDWSGISMCGHMCYVAAGSHWNADSASAGGTTSAGLRDIFDRDGPWGPTYGGL
jgi:nickel/cobalt transporter (NiCoT) family protein